MLTPIRIKSLQFALILLLALPPVSLAMDTLAKNEMFQTHFITHTDWQSSLSTLNTEPSPLGDSDPVNE